MRLTSLDLIAAAMDRPQRPLHWTMVVHLPHSPDLTALERGAASARLAFPSSTAVRDGSQWRPAAAQAIEQRSLTGTGLRAEIERFANAPMDITMSPAVRQRQLSGGDIKGAVLLTKVHHAAADLVGGTLWVQHQLSVAIGTRSPEESPSRYEPPPLRTHPHLSRKSAFAYRGSSDRLAHDGGATSATRQWHTIVVPSSALRGRAAADTGFTYNDLLSACAFDAITQWNTQRQGQRAQQLGLWLPTNIRVAPLDGFGNGSSRIRVYNRFNAAGSFADRARSIRRQVQWSREHGEWAVPSLSGAERLPMSVLAPVLRMYFNRPWVDMGTAALSHAQRSPFDELPPQLISRVELVGTLDTRHPFGIFALTLGDNTHFTFVHDPAQLSDQHAAELTVLFTSALNAAGARAT